MFKKDERLKNSPQSSFRLHRYNTIPSQSATKTRITHNAKYATQTPQNAQSTTQSSNKMTKAVHFKVSVAFANAYVPLIQAKARQLRVRGWLVQLNASSLVGVFVGPSDAVENMKRCITVFMDSGNRLNVIDFQDEQELASVTHLPRRFLMIRKEDLHY